MKFTIATALSVLAFTSQAMATVSFNVAVAGVSCGHGTQITCSSPSPGSPCKGNFTPSQASIVVTEAQGNCHISLYSGSNQSGTITERLNTDTTGTCVFFSTNVWASYGIYCD